MKQKEYIGFGSINCLSLVLTKLPAKKIFLVTGKDSYVTSGAQCHLCQFLVDYEVTRFSDFDNNPKIEDVIKALEIFKRIRFDTVIAVGGGSVLDMAKLINFFGVNDLEPREYIRTKKNDVQKGKPLIAIPTTAGSGSEATSFAVIYVNQEKLSVDDELLLPDVAIVEPDLMMSLPKYITATTGMDALSQAIESYWNINSKEQSKGFARSAIELIIPNIVTAVTKPSASSRLAMARAAHLAGKAINITRTTVPHAISYPLTSYFGIPHGHAVSLTLPSILEYNAGVTENDVLDVRGCEYVRKILNEIALFLGAKDIVGAKEKINKLMCKIGLETKLSLLGVKSEENIELIIANGFNPARVKNNPRILKEDSLRKILYTIY